MRRDDDSTTMPQTLPSGLDPERLVLRVLTDGALLSHPLPRGRVVVGRGRDADIRIDHTTLSRHHAAFEIGDAVTVSDLGSANGTRVGDVAVLDEPVAIGLDQPVHLGSVLVLVQHGGPSARAIAPPTSRAGFPERIRPVLERIAQGRITVLLLGETGVGKEVMACTTHALGPRASKPLVIVNCAALTETLLESELFGHERGAFTGATTAKVGLIESADGGTLFLDEVGELPLALQAKLLRVVEDRAVQRIGAVRPNAVDVRFLAATNRDLEAEVAAGRFRSDLYFRINGFSLTVPPLRERRDEIPALVTSFVADFAALEGHAPPAVTPAALALLVDAAWPGNIRELRNVIERAVLLCGTSAIDVEQLPVDKVAPAPPGPPRSEPPRALRDEVRELERKRIIDVLARCAGNQSRAARELGISRPTLITRMEEYNLPRPRKD